MKIDISELDISTITLKHLKKHQDIILTAANIWNLVMDIQHDFDAMLIEINNRQSTHDWNKRLR